MNDQSQQGVREMCVKYGEQRRERRIVVNMGVTGRKAIQAEVKYVIFMSLSRGYKRRKEE